MTATHHTSAELFDDPIMHGLYQKVLAEGEFPKNITGPSPDQYFWSLCSSIIGQQLSEKVAPIIESRVKVVLKNELNPESVLSTSDDQLRAAGLSFSKISYLKNVAVAWQSGEINPSALANLTDEEVIAQLIKIKGVGRWTAEMFLIFTLARPDIFSVGDYGLRRAISLAYEIPMETKPKELLELSATWAPNRSLASRLLWRSLDLL